MALSQATLTTSAANVYVSSGTTAVTTMYLCNYSASDVTATIYLAQSGASATDANIIYKQIPIAASDTYIIDTERLVLDNGDMIKAFCSANTALTMTVSYVGV